MSSRSTADLLRVVSEKIARAFNRSGTTQADISKAWYNQGFFQGFAGLFLELTFYEVSGQIFSLTLSFLSNRWLCVFLDGKCSQEYPVNTGTPQGSILGPAHFLLCINDLQDDVICNIADDTYANDTTLYCKFDQASDLWQQVELVSELESDIQDTVDWDMKWFICFNALKWMGLFLR